MKYITTLLISIVVLCLPLDIQAKDFNYNRNSNTVSELQEKTNFKILVPTKMNQKWVLHTKTYNESERIIIALHFLDENEKELMVAIRQTKNSSGLRKSIVKSEKIEVNSHAAHYIGWADGSVGGQLIWVQAGTYIEMLSQSLSKNKMLEIARTMK
ncbi:DUF4367 domain-containing protein [Gottfriedia acidiceleris]|uniref:DUF4367 domain-containing protein n=1 Tax=Gottfriedia acidiceleris TaxID=371036 RepID=UPI002FFF6AD5